MHDVIVDRNARAVCICVYAEKLVSPAHERIDGDCNLTPGRCRRIVGPPLSTRIIAAKNVNRSAYSFRVTAGRLMRNITRGIARTSLKVVKKSRALARTRPGDQRDAGKWQLAILRCIMVIQCHDIRRREPAGR